MNKEDAFNKLFVAANKVIEENDWDDELAINLDNLEKILEEVSPVFSKKKDNPTMKEKARRKPFVNCFGVKIV